MDVKGARANVNKYFLACVIPGTGGSDIERMKLELLGRYGLKGALRSPAHITLHRPFEWKETKENELKEKLNRFDFGDEFTVSLKDFAAFAPRVIYVNVLENDALNDLHHRLTAYARKELKLLNEAGDLRGFHPHVTIASRDLKPRGFQQIWPEFESRKYAFSFACGGFSLLRLGKTWQEIAFFGSRP